MVHEEYTKKLRDLTEEKDEEKAAAKRREMTREISGMTEDEVIVAAECIRMNAHLRQRYTDPVLFTLISGIYRRMSVLHQEAAAEPATQIKLSERFELAIGSKEELREKRVPAWPTPVPPQ
jgi:hypothetical protein